MAVKVPIFKITLHRMKWIWKILRKQWKFRIIEILTNDLCVNMLVGKNN